MPQLMGTPRERQVELPDAILTTLQGARKTLEGILTDAPGFLMENIHEAGAKAKRSTESMQRAFDGEPLTNDVMSDIIGLSPLAAGGVFRDLTHQRVTGALFTEQVATLLEQAPGFARAQRLIQSTMRQKLGDEFFVFRASRGAKEELTEKAVGASLNPTAASGFLESGRKFFVSRITPEDVFFSVVKRGGVPHESEILVKSKEFFAKAKGMSQDEFSAVAYRMEHEVSSGNFDVDLLGNLIQWFNVGGKSIKPKFPAMTPLNSNIPGVSFQEQTIAKVVNDVKAGKITVKKFLGWFTKGEPL